MPGGGAQYNQEPHVHADPSSPSPAMIPAGADK